MPPPPRGMVWAVSCLVSSSSPSPLANGCGSSVRSSLRNSRAVFRQYSARTPRKFGATLEHVPPPVDGRTQTESWVGRVLQRSSVPPRWLKADPELQVVVVEGSLVGEGSPRRLTLCPVFDRFVYRETYVIL